MQDCRSRCPLIHDSRTPYAESDVCVSQNQCMTRDQKDATIGACQHCGRRDRTLWRSSRTRHAIHCCRTLGGLLALHLSITRIWAYLRPRHCRKRAMIPRRLVPIWRGPLSSSYGARSARPSFHCSPTPPPGAAPLSPTSLSVFVPRHQPDRLIGFCVRSHRFLSVL